LNIPPVATDLVVISYLSSGPSPTPKSLTKALYFFLALVAASPLVLDTSYSLRLLSNLISPKRPTLMFDHDASLPVFGYKKYAIPQTYSITDGGLAKALISVSDF